MKISDNKNCLTEIAEMVAEQNSSYLNFSHRLRIAEIRTKQIGSDADPIKSDIQGLQLSLQDLLHPINDGIDVRGKLSEIDDKVQRIETRLTT